MCAACSPELATRSSPSPAKVNGETFSIDKRPRALVSNDIAEFVNSHYGLKKATVEVADGRRPEV
jgi:hypothetical protein